MICLFLGAPLVETRTYRISGTLDTNGRSKVTRVYDAEKKTLSIHTKVDWDDKHRNEERYLFDALGQPIEVAYDEVRGKDETSYRLTPEGGFFRTTGGWRGDRLHKEPFKGLADPSQFWFVRDVPETGATLKYKDYRAPFFFDDSTVAYLGKQPMKIDGVEHMVHVVERIVGNCSPRIVSYLDDTGMPIRREWTLSKNGSPYRVEVLVK